MPTCWSAPAAFASPADVRLHMAAEEVRFCTQLVERRMSEHCIQMGGHDVGLGGVDLPYVETEERNVGSRQPTVRLEVLIRTVSEVVEPVEGAIQRVCGGVSCLLGEYGIDRVVEIAEVAEYRTE